MTHQYISRKGSIITEGTFQECENARIHHGYADATIISI